MGSGTPASESWLHAMRPVTGPSYRGSTITAPSFHENGGRDNTPGDSISGPTSTDRWAFMRSRPVTDFVTDRDLRKQQKRPGYDSRAFDFSTNLIESARFNRNS